MTREARVTAGFLSADRPSVVFLRLQGASHETFPRLLAIGALCAAVVAASPAYAAPTIPTTAYEMPFPCGQTWTGTTRPSHSPSHWSVDWNRTDDIGDPVVAAAAGVVTKAVPNGTHGYGRYVELDHGNGESTIYGHLSTVVVGVGQTVDQGTLLGTVGETGNATGPHLHFEERYDKRTCRRGSTPRPSCSVRRSSPRTAPTCRSRATSSATASRSSRVFDRARPPSRSRPRRVRSACPGLEHRHAGRG